MPCTLILSGALEVWRLRLWFNSRVGKNHDALKKIQKSDFLNLNLIFLFKSDHDLY